MSLGWGLRPASPSTEVDTRTSLCHALTRIAHSASSTMLVSRKSTFGLSAINIFSAISTHNCNSIATPTHGQDVQVEFLRKRSCRNVSHPLAPSLLYDCCWWEGTKLQSMFRFLLFFRWWCILCCLLSFQQEQQKNGVKTQNENGACYRGKYCFYIAYL